MVGKLLDIFRVAHNFINVHKNKGAKPSTAARRIGLVEAPVSYGHVVYFKLLNKINVRCYFKEKQQKYIIIQRSLNIHLLYCVDAI